MLAFVGKGSIESGRGVSSLGVARPQVRLALSEGLGCAASPEPWIGPLVALGGMASRLKAGLPGRQVVVAISVPRRDYAAALVGCGWVAARPERRLDEPLAILRQLQPRTAVRLVTDDVVLTDYFLALDEQGEPRVHLRRSKWMLSHVKAVATLDDMEFMARSARPRLGSLGRWANLDATWYDRLALPSSDLAIVGTLKWLREDLSAVLSVVDDPEAVEVLPPADERTLRDFLLPREEEAATWFSQFIASTQLADQLPLPSGIEAVILDGVGAIKYLAAIEVPVVVCVVDRSVADESAAEIVVQLRNSRGEPHSLAETIGWRPTAGIEAFAFSVAL